jgi:spermidine/putrescine transport system substrate-binding protein
MAGPDGGPGTTPDDDDRTLASPDLLRGLTQPRLTRRRALQLGGMAALTAGLAGCSIARIPHTKLGLAAEHHDKSVIEAFWAKQHKTGQLDFANWPLYIDVNPKNQNDHPSLDLFTKQTGIKVTYTEAILENDSFFGKELPVLAAGKGSGYDLIVITNGIYLTDFIQLDFLTPLDQSRMTNFYKNASPLVKNPSYDPGNTYTMAWQSGITGIGYNPKYTGRDITSWDDLLDPKFKGKVGMFADNQDLPNSALCAIGIKPETSTPADWKKAAEWLTKQRPQVRAYYDQGYVGPLSRGELYVSMAWSGDIFQANASGGAGGDLKFVVPKEGAPIWTDNMCIPTRAEHPLDAMTYMDYVYQPEIADMLAEYINYITPVPAVQQVLQQKAKTATKKSDKQFYESLATSPLIFPSKSDFSKLHRYRVLDHDEEVKWNALFEPIYQA